MWFASMAPGRCSELVLPTFRWRRSGRVAGGGDLSSSSLDDDVGGGGVTGVPLAMGKTPMGVADSDDASWVIGIVWTAARWCGDG
jgi:hypothetical protein